MIRYLQFTLERLLLRGVQYRLLAAALIVVTVAVIAGVMVWILDPNFDELGGAVWWAFLRLTDPGYLGDDEGTVSRTISTLFVRVQPESLALSPWEVLISFGVTVLKGVRIGRAAVIAAGAIVTKDVPPESVYMNEVQPRIIPLKDYM